ncbi:hypothetical protein ACFFMN_09185 [Planobispora siamensis]|uniref:Uncharacterized protein n=1 Tax=Planobispora siamensis TaxID=936338 RepID=A0A8J3SDJ7_9ACTN|nr:hypothetical protein [Planobispora siamensis]GIH91155.1 hypothetical protein Psi01_17850 [Planobispora siamensis]
MGESPQYGRYRHDAVVLAEIGRRLRAVMGEMAKRVFVLLRGRRPVAKLEVDGEDFPRLYCRVHPLPGFEAVRPVLEKAWESVENNGSVWPIVRMRLLRLRLRPDCGGPLITRVMVILDGERAVLRYRYGLVARRRLR